MIVRIFRERFFANSFIGRASLTFKVLEKSWILIVRPLLTFKTLEKSWILIIRPHLTFKALEKILHFMMIGQFLNTLVEKSIPALFFSLSHKAIICLMFLHVLL